MPKDKDRKRLARARLAKTGESYTAARAQLLAKHAPLSGDAKHAPLSGDANRKEKATGPTDAELAALGGQSDATMLEKTGRTWRQWLEVLDAVGAPKMSHTEIARHVYGALGVPGWWAQAVTVGYERMRGLREVGQRRGGLYEAGKTKTFPVAIAKLYAAVANARLRAKWLPGVKLEVRTATVNKSMRVTWPDGTSVIFAFASKGPAKSTLSLVHTKLESRTAITETKAFWTKRLAALADVL
jgi:hypothetical protein